MIYCCLLNGIYSWPLLGFLFLFLGRVLGWKGLLSSYKTTKGPWDPWSVRAGPEQHIQNAGWGELCGPFGIVLSLPWKPTVLCTLQRKPIKKKNRLMFDTKSLACLLVYLKVWHRHMGVTWLKSRTVKNKNNALWFFFHRSRDRLSDRFLLRWALHCLLLI